MKFLELFESEDRWVTLGTYHDGLLKVRRVEFISYVDSNGESPTHAGLGLHDPDGRWRYPEGAKQVFWWQQPTEEAKAAVDAYLAKRGFSGLRHEVMLDDSLEDEVSSGRISVKRYLRDMEKKSLHPCYKSMSESNWYLNIGHTAGSECWVLTGSRIRTSKVYFDGLIKSELHSHPKIKAKGRIDHEKKVITVVGDDDDTISYCKGVLLKRYPGYRTMTTKW